MEFILFVFVLGLFAILLVLILGSILKRVIDNWNWKKVIKNLASLAVIAVIVMIIYTIYTAIEIHSLTASSQPLVDFAKGFENISFNKIHSFKKSWSELVFWGFVSLFMPIIIWSELSIFYRFLKE